MEASVSNFVEQLKQTLDEEISKIKIKERGTNGWVTKFADGVAEVGGLEDARIGQVLRFASSSERAIANESGELDIVGVVEDIDEDVVQCLVFGEEKFVMQGDRVELLKGGEVLTIPATHRLLGRVVDPFGRPLDYPLTKPANWPANAQYKECDWLDVEGSGPSRKVNVRDGILELPIERKSPGVTDRTKVNQQLHTGIKAVDAMLPIGKGQRMLVIGDRGTGKTSLALDAIIRQNELNARLNGPLKAGDDRTGWFLRNKTETVYCVYVGIGKKASEIDQIRKKLENNNAMDYTIIITSMANDPAPLSYICPFSGCTIAEYFRDIGRNALIVYDDLSKHATAYRQISLLLKRPPGREAYPGDIFFLHSRLLERAANLRSSKDSDRPLVWSADYNAIIKPYAGKSGEYASHEGGSLTAIPLVETRQDDYSTYIATNIISITDGQIFLSTKIKNEGTLPAINVGISVSRVKSWGKPLREFADGLRETMAVFRELKRFALFESTQSKKDEEALTNGHKYVAYFKQEERPSFQRQANATSETDAAAFPIERQVLALFALREKVFFNVPDKDVNAVEARFWNAFKDSQLCRKLGQDEAIRSLSDGEREEILKQMKSFAAPYESGAPR